MVSGMGVATSHADGMDWESTYKSIEKVAAGVRSGEGPALIEIDAYRWREHCGPNYDNDIGYRTEEEYLSWKAKDPQVRLEKDLIGRGLLSSADIEDMDKRIGAEIDEAFDFAVNASYPASSSAGNYQYAKEVR